MQIYVAQNVKLSNNLKMTIPYTDTYLTKLAYIRFSAVRFRFLDKLTLATIRKL